jgi:hypothetical protein
MAEAPFKVLGWCPERKLIWYQHRQTGQIDAIHATAQAGPLLKLAPMDWWATRHPGGGATGFNVVACLDEVIQQADAAGVFSLDRLRGRGVWMDGTKVVWHLGDQLEVDGKPVKLIDFDRAFYYQRLPKLAIDPSMAPLSDAEGQEILKAVKAMGWCSPLDHLHLLGWIVLATVGGALDKRPVLQITCGFGKGKTYTLTVVIWPLLAGLAISQSNSTEAAIRQTLNTDTLPVLIDESEGEDHKRRGGHLKLARISFDGVETGRGTSHGKALTYAVRSSIALVGINATVTNPADRSRVVEVGRQPLPPQQWGPVDQKLRELLTVDTGARVLRRTVTHLPTLLANVATFRRVVEAQLPAGAAARAGDTYGALLAGAHLLTSTNVVDEAEALNWLDAVKWGAAEALGVDAAPEQSAAAEGEQCLAKLLSYQESWRSDDKGSGKITVRELLGHARSPGNSDEAEVARKVLGRLGIRATDVGVMVANQAEALAPIYGNTKWRDQGHIGRLRDLPGAEPGGLVHFPALTSHKATKIPWAALGG